jgi:hypothetical protein
MNIMKFRYISLLTILLVVSCKKFVEIDPPQTQIVRSTVFSTPGGAESAINGIYSQMMSSSGFASGGFQSIGYLAGLSADELANYTTDLEQTAFFTNSLLPTNQTLNNYLWQEGYRILYQANAVIEGLSSSGLDSATESTLTGEARFIRAFCNFYLTNLFGEIPLVTTTDYSVNNSLVRSSRQDVENEILDDLTSAQHQLADFYLSPTGTPTEDRIRPNKYAATALLARLYLYSEDWQDAEMASSILIDKSDTYSLW